MHWVFGKGAMSQNIVSFYLWNQELCLKQTNNFDQIWGKKQTVSTPSTSSKCSSLAINLMMLKFLEDILHLLNWNYLKFETNPTVDLKETTILNKNPEACSWKSFHELHYNYFLHTTSFHAICLHTTFFPWTTFFHT
jgi:hypothetical protein